MAARKKPQTVLAAVTAGDELEALKAMRARLAMDIDDPNTRVMARSDAIKRLQETYDRIRQLEPPAEKADRLDDLTARRSRRRRSAA